MFTTVRWPIRENCRRRFYVLLPEVKTFVGENKSIPNLSNEEWIADLTFMVDVTADHSLLNGFLQGNNKFYNHDLCSAVSASITKLCLRKT